jgi:hypothetical protein
LPAGAAGPIPLVINNPGTRLYVGNFSSSNLATFDITGGTPVSLGNTPLPGIASGPHDLAVK